MKLNIHEINEKVEDEIQKKHENVGENENPLES